MENNSQVKPKGNLSKLLWILLAVILVPIILTSIFSGGNNSSPDITSSISVPQTICDQDQTALRKSAQQISYKQLSKDPTSSQGQVATFRGQIIQIQQSGNEGVIRLSVTDLGSGYWSPSDVIYITYHQATPAVEGDIVSVIGQLTGAETYTSQANYKITIPSMDVCSVNTTSPTKTTSTTSTKTKSVSSVPSTSNVQSAPTPTTPSTYTTPSGAVIDQNGGVVSAPAPSPQQQASDDQSTAQQYYNANHTCVGLSGNQYADCVTYSYNQPAPTTSQSVSAINNATWHTAYTYSNNTTIQTLSFTMQGTQWKATYSCTASNGAGVFGAFIQATNGHGGETISDGVNCPNTETSYFYSVTPGQYYLSIDANTNYNITVEDYY